MADFVASFGFWLVATFIPSFVGILVVTFGGRRIRPAILSGFALGVFLWYFVDTLGGAATLDVSDGLSISAQQVSLLILFAIGGIAFFLVDRDVFSAGASARPVLVVALMVALATGLHGYGEGSAFGSTASTTLAGSLLDAFGGVQAGIAYAMHKFLEAFMVGTVYVGLVRSSSLRHAVALSSVFVLPSLLGAAIGYYVSDFGVYIFGLGTGAALYLAARLMKGIFQAGSWSPEDGPKVAVAMVVGFLCIYAAALLHS